MKTTYIITLLIALVSLITSAQIVNIPDPVFKDSLVNHNVVDTNGNGSGDSNADTNNDGEIQVSEAEAVIGLHLAITTIYSLEGLQSFINLEVFNSTYQQFTSIDVSTMPNLRELSISNNLLGSLDISQNTNLEILYCDFNNLTQLDTSQNINLIVLNCSQNQITSLNTSQNINLIGFYCPGNLLTALDLTHNPNIEQLNLGSNNVTELDLTQNTNLILLFCSGNFLNELDISQNINLKGISCGFNSINELETNYNLMLESLDCQQNQISTLDVSENISLSWLFCNNNQLTSLNIQNGMNENLVKMHAHENPNLTCIQVDNPVYANAQICEEFTGWCKDESAFYSEDCSLGTEDVLMTKITLYPNPVQDVLSIGNISKYDIYSIQIFDIIGKLILDIPANKVVENNIIQLDISNLNRGLLFLIIETNKGIVAKKIVKL